MLEPIKFFCNCALPAVYDDSLSYYEVLTKLAYKLNDTITALNTLTVSVTGDANTQELKANVLNVNYDNSVGDYGGFVQTNAPITTVPQAISETNDSLKWIAQGTQTIAYNIGTAVKDNANAINDIIGNMKKVAFSLTANENDFTYAKQINVVTYDDSTHKFTAIEGRITDLETATFNLSVDLEAMVDGINNNTDLNDIEHNSLSTRLHTAENNILQLEQTDVQELADISKLKTSITGSDNAVFSNVINAVSYNTDNQQFENKSFGTVTNIQKAFTDQNSTVAGVISGLNSMKEDIKNNSSELTQNLALLSGQVNDLENTVDGLSSSLNISGWNRIGSGNIVIITPDPYTGFDDNYIKQYANAAGFKLTESNQIFLLNPGTPTIRNLSLSQQAIAATGGMTTEQKSNTTMVYLVGTGGQSLDTNTTITSAKEAFPNAHFVYAPDCWFSAPTLEESVYMINYNAFGCSVVRNGWKYLVGSDINTSAIPQVAYDQAPDILLDLLFTGDSNRYTEVRYYGGSGSTTTFANPGFILRRYGKECIIQEYAANAGVSQPPFGVASYTNCFRLTKYLAFANVTVTNYSGTTYQSSGAISCADISGIQCAYVRGAIINPTQVPTAIIKTASLNIV